MPLGDDIKQARERAGLTQRALAELVGVSLATISNWERSKHLPKSSLARLSDALRRIEPPVAPDRSAEPPDDLRGLSHGQLWAARRRYDAEIERRYYEAMASHQHQEGSRVGQAEGTVAPGRGQFADAPAPEMTSTTRRPELHIKPNADTSGDAG